MIKLSKQNEWNIQSKKTHVVQPECNKSDTLSLFILFPNTKNKTDEILLKFITEKTWHGLALKQ